MTWPSSAVAGLAAAWLPTIGLLALSTVLLAVPAVSETLPGPGIWQELAGTRFDQSPAVCGKPGAPAPPLCVPTLLPDGGNNLFAGIFGAWSGGAFDTLRRQFVIAATGGHNDWAGNQVVALRLPAGDTPAGWLSLKGPSMAYPVNPTPSVCPYSDQTPCSVHLYDATAYLPDQDAIWWGGGFIWYSGNWTRQAWLFAPTSATWTRKADRPVGTGAGMASIWDPVARRLIYRDQAALRSYDPATDTTITLKSLGPDSFAEEMSTAALDAKGRKFYRIRRKQPRAPAGTALKLLDLNNLAAGEQTLYTTGDLDVETPQGVGMLFHAARIVAHGKTPDGLNSALFSLNPAGCGLTNQPPCVWTRWTPPSGALPPTGNVRGVWKKFFLDTDGETFYVILGADKNVWRMKSPW